MAIGRHMDISVSAATYDVIANAARTRRTSMTAIVTAAVEPALPPVDDLVGRPCTGCRRETPHRLVRVVTHRCHACADCGRETLEEIP